jgi:SAM-dependent methyltransferase
MLTDKRVDFEIDQIINMTQPSPKHSTFLDIGSGTGDLVARLQEKGYHVYGIDKSEKMIERTEAKHGDHIQVKCADAKEPMLYEKGSFTHILCMGLTVYEFQDKRVFFKNCYNWLQPGGYLVIHLVDRNHFDPIIPAGKPPIADSPQKYSNKRITDTLIDFIDFTYKAAFQFDDSKKTAVLKETFTDGVSKKVRQNELVLHMDDMDAIMKTAAYCGFLVQGQVSTKNYNHDEYQYIVVFERPQGV